jgi:hypothetical protein
MALSGHRDSVEECPLSGVKRTSKFESVTSAFDPKRTSDWSISVAIGSGIFQRNNTREGRKDGGIMASDNINDPKHWRDRAAEMRASAEETKDADNRKIMLRLASDYDQLAERAEIRLNDKRSKSN